MDNYIVAMAVFACFYALLALGLNLVWGMAGMINLGLVEYRKKNYAEAESFLLSGYEGMKQREDKIPQQGKPRVRESVQRLVQLYEATDRLEQAAEWRKKLAETDKAQK